MKTKLLTAVLGLSLGTLISLPVSPEVEKVK